MPPASLILLLALSSVAVDGAPLRIEVRDSLGGVVPAAVVALDAAGVTATTDGNGRAEFPIPLNGSVVITVRAPGFATERRTIALPAGADPTIQIVLVPETLATTVTVTAARTDTHPGGVAPSTSVLRASDLATAPGVTLDDALRHTPGFSLFRRSTSRVSNPTTQGVTLRGLTASGASRTLVLADGIPLNDPFGGWVSWNRVPLAAIDRVEVVRGGASDLYGPDALGGVIQVFTLEPRRSTARLYADAGGQRTFRASTGGVWQSPRSQLFGALEAASSEGYVLVAPESRGTIDTSAGGSSQTGIARIGTNSGAWSVRAGGDVWREERQNGTPFQRNDNAARMGSATIGHAAGNAVWRVRAFGGTQGYDQTFSAVSADRASETPTQTQRVPSEAYGVAGDIAGGRARVRVLAGLEQRHVRAVNEEVRFVAGTPAATVRAGGEQDFLGAFGQVVAEPWPSVSLLGGVRVERWSVDSFQSETIDDDLLVAPRLSAAWRIRPDFVIQGAVSRSYRAPTLNERFRGFRVGDTQTRPNALLEPERLTAFEAGASFIRGRTTLRATGFLNALDDAITNVTVSTTPALITRERRNAGSIDAPGLELEAAFSLTDRMRASVSASFVDSRFGDDAPGGIAGNRTPQSPRYQTAAELGWDGPPLSLAARVLLTGAQYEDDRNTLLLNEAVTVDLMVSRTFAPGWLGFVAGENLFDEDYDVGRTPLRTIGSPRMFRVGLRWAMR
jgi:outer membrane receptor protein involved in Fe transport